MFLKYTFAVCAFLLCRPDSVARAEAAQVKAGGPGRGAAAKVKEMGTAMAAAVLVAAALLGERFSAGDALGGLLIVLAVAVNDELIRVPGRMCLAPHCDDDGAEVGVACYCDASGARIDAS